MTRRPPRSPLFPSTPLSRSGFEPQTCITVWASHGDKLDQPPPQFRVTASSANAPVAAMQHESRPDRKSTRLNSSHSQISYAVFCLKKKTTYVLSPSM